MYKKCVQLVQDLGQNTVSSLPRFVRLTHCQQLLYRLRLNYTHILTSLPTQAFAVFAQSFSPNSPHMNDGFYPQSTTPTITTTIYI